MRNTFRAVVQGLVGSGLPPPSTDRSRFGGEEEAHVHRAFLAVPDPPVFLRFEDPEQHGLHFQGQLAHLVEEQGALVRLGQHAFLGLLRAGERALAVAEQLAAQQFLV